MWFAYQASGGFFGVPYLKGCEVVKILFFIVWLMGVLVTTFWYLDCRDFGVRQPKVMLASLVVFYVVMLTVGEGMM